MEKQMKILIIDDAQYILDNTAMLLEFEGYEVDTAHNGVEGVEKAFADVSGAYPTINYEFLQHNASLGFSFVNREDDTGDEGLRKSKTDYHPVKMIEKTIVTLKRHRLEIIPE